jgi:hypothetical protein
MPTNGRPTTNDDRKTTNGRPTTNDDRKTTNDDRKTTKVSTVRSTRTPRAR